GKVPFVIRDDDTCYFTNPDMISRVHECAWSRGFPVTISVIPKCRADIRCEMKVFGEDVEFDPLIPPNLRGEKGNYPVDGNKELSSFLLGLESEGKVEIAQHGLTHSKSGNLGEFENPNKSLLSSRIQEGRRILRRAGFAPKIFIAPFEKISSAGWKAISSDFDYVHTAARIHVTPFYPLPFYRVSPLKFLQEFKAGIAENQFLNIYSRFLILRSCGSTFDLESEPKASLEEAKNRLSNDLVNENPSVWLSHYWEWFFDWSDDLTFGRHLKAWEDFLEHAAAQPIWPATVYELMRWRAAFSRLRIRHSKKSLRISAGDFLPEGLTIVGKGEVQTNAPIVEQDAERFVFGNIQKGGKIVVRTG
ncbi:MAG: DUF2334 domain-containing protein, partial [Thermoplasmata archaeon]